MKKLQQADLSQLLFIDLGRILNQRLDISYSIKFINYICR